ncbi:hypothetical protein ACFVZD_36885 [Streptomyces sp. NPDC058287]|uniref:hypothetical protein n=1 Tax=Streptomyces sp. NPDC058287 TaxID=3346423 RepID=UPI0036E10330
MISLHDAYNQGPEAVREAIRAFGALHPLASGTSGTEPDWATAERHFTHLIEVIMREAIPAQDDAKAIVRRAENEALQLLLALAPVGGYRCPICVMHRRFDL